VSSDLDAWLDAVRAGVAAARTRAGAFAQHVSVRATTDSTNDDVARAAIEGAPEGYTVVAAGQTAGRGRRGAGWYSPTAHGLYLSTLLRPDRWSAVRADAASPASSLVTLMAGTAVLSAIHDVCAITAELKWPNDVMVRAARSSVPGRAPAGESGGGDPPVPPWRKLAGILAEGASEHGVLRSVVLGIGVNVRATHAPAEISARMVSLDELMPAATAAGPAPVSSLVSALLVRLREGVDLLAGGSLDEVRARWRRHAPSVEDTAVRWHHHGKVRSGRTAGIDEIGALRVRLDDGGEATVHGGDMEWLLEPWNA
jgi:BirA family transcriptional regulator, biotin operon repressor / biotin---[acetyl-CoA-carboxylase] ligase